MIKLTKYELEKVKDFAYMVGLALGLIIGFITDISIESKVSAWLGALTVYIIFWIYLNWNRRKLLKDDY